MAPLTTAMMGLLMVAGAERLAQTSTKFAAWSVIASSNGTLAPAIGTVRKHGANPLLIQDQPWELRLDNGYPNVVHR